MASVVLKVAGWFVAIIIVLPNTLLCSAITNMNMIDL